MVAGVTCREERAGARADVEPDPPDCPPPPQAINNERENKTRTNDAVFTLVSPIRFLGSNISQLLKRGVLFAFYLGNSVFDPTSGYVGNPFYSCGINGLLEA